MKMEMTNQSNRFAEITPPRRTRKSTYYHLRTPGKGTELPPSFQDFYIIPTQFAEQSFSQKDIQLNINSAKKFDSTNTPDTYRITSDKNPFARPRTYLVTQQNEIFDENYKKTLTPISKKDVSIALQRHHIIPKCVCDQYGKDTLIGKTLAKLKNSQINLVLLPSGKGTIPKKIIKTDTPHRSGIALGDRKTIHCGKHTENYFKFIKNAIKFINQNFKAEKLIEIALSTFMSKLGEALNKGEISLKDKTSRYQIFFEKIKKNLLMETELE